MSQINGRISQIIGPVIDVYFDTRARIRRRCFLKFMKL